MKLGLALGSGSLRGMAHVGVLQVLKENGIKPDLIAGTSIGAVVGGVVATGGDPHFLEKIALSLNLKDYYDFALPQFGFIKGEKLLAMFRTLTANKDFSQSDIPFAAVACDIRTDEMLEIRQGKVCDAMRASSSIPGIFVPFQMGENVLCDGGIIEQVPIRTARKMGADVVIAVSVSYMGYGMDTRNIAEVLIHTFDIMGWEMCKGRLNEADVLIAPPMADIDPTSMRDAKKCIELGREHCTMALPAIFDAIARAEDRADGSEVE